MNELIAKRDTDDGLKNRISDLEAVIYRLKSENDRLRRIAKLNFRSAELYNWEQESPALVFPKPAIGLKRRKKPV